MHSWHDYHLTGYAVNGAERQIIFNILWPYETDVEIRSANIVFTGIEGYFFEHDLGSNIIYAIQEASAKKFLFKNADFFEQQHKWGWPLFWQGDSDKTLEYLTNKHARLFEICSSYGLSGWILASNVEHHELT